MNAIPLNTTSSSACVSCTPYIVLFAVFLVTSVIIGAVFVYFYWHSKKDIVRQYLKKNNVSIKFNPFKQYLKKNNVSIKFNPFKQQIIKLINGKY